MIKVEGSTVTATCDRCGLQMVLASGSIGLEVAASPSRQADVLDMADWTCGADEPDLCEKCAHPENTEPVNYSEAWRRKIYSDANSAVSTSCKPA